MQKCLTCEGRKKVRGIGMMNVNCPVCKGKGVLNPVPVVHADKKGKKENLKGERNEA